jgi:hypothetical protein
VRDGTALARHTQMASETEGLAEPIDCGWGIPITQTRNDDGVFALRLGRFNVHEFCSPVTILAGRRFGVL